MFPFLFFLFFCSFFVSGSICFFSFFFFGVRFALKEQGKEKRERECVGLGNSYS